MLDFCWLILYRQSHAPFLPFAFPNGQALGEKERACILLLLCTWVLRQVLEKLILNTFQSNPNQDVGLLLPDGSIHPVQAGLRMVETFRFRCRESVEADPLRPVAMVYEEKLSKIKAELADTESQADIEDFVSTSSGYVPKPV